MSTRGEAFSLKRLQRASLFLDTYAKPLKTKPKRRRTAQFTAQKFHRSPIPLKVDNYSLSTPQNRPLVLACYTSRHMREIKFRAWDGLRMRVWGFIGTDAFASPPTSSHSKYSNAFSMPHMQFTGLRDRNGKEIYEGDILRDTVNRPPRKRVVEFLGSGFWCADEKFKHFMPGEQHREVIGNIYENPELLGEKLNEVT